jgi:hypothetical protein
MSRRKRHAGKTQVQTQIEWLKHRTGYPSPEEREQIIKLRTRLSMEVIMLGIQKDSSGARKYRELVEKYGAEEVKRAEQKIREGMEIPSLIADDVKSYREYRQRYSRFGGELKFYSPLEMDELHETYRGQMKSFISDDESEISETGVEINKLLLYGWRDWEDITPPAVPPKPAGFNAPQPAAYSAPINELLDWGDSLAKTHVFPDDADYKLWQRFIPALTRMALDPGLLNGWVTDHSSWAPWHAIHMLGTLQAWESAPAIAELADLENDWVSDHLPHIWAEMGPEVEPSLWMILETQSASAKRRGLAADALTRLTQDNDALYGRVLTGFEKIVAKADKFDPKLNGYLVNFLKDMDISDSSLDNLYKAFDENRVDTTFITPDDLEDKYDGE